ncbi:unnamed protein product [Chrysoparadoxa australica]
MGAARRTRKQEPAPAPLAEPAPVSKKAKKLDGSSPSAYEAMREEKIAANAALMESLGLGAAKAELSHTAATIKEVKKQARARGLKSKKSAPREPTRRSSRLTGEDTHCEALEDPEALFGSGKQTYAPPRFVSYRGLANASTADSTAAAPERTRLPDEPVPMLSLNTSPEASAGVRELIKEQGAAAHGWMTRTSTSVAPAARAAQLSKLSVRVDTVAKCVKDRGTAITMHPGSDKIVVALGDKSGNFALWCPDEDGSNAGDNGVYSYRPHTGLISQLQWWPTDCSKLVSTSYDGTVRCMDANTGQFSLLYSNDEDDGVLFTMGEISCDASVMYLSDSAGDVTALDPRSSKPAWETTLHAKKVNSVQICPSNPHVLVTASLDYSACLWDVRKCGSSKKPKPMVTMPHNRSLNSIYFNATGEWLVSVCRDDKLHVYKNACQSSGILAPFYSINHNNNTGRWLTKFQTTWDPYSPDVFAVGSMGKGPHGLDFFHCSDKKSKSTLHRMSGGDVMTSIQSLIALHPVMPDIACGVNSSGRCNMFR